MLVLRLTAYVARTFISASKYITIDPNVIQEAMKFIMSHQTENGSFREPGRVIHYGMVNKISAFVT